MPHASSTRRTARGGGSGDLFGVNQGAVSAPPVAPLPPTSAAQTGETFFERGDRSSADLRRQQQADRAARGAARASASEGEANRQLQRDLAPRRLTASDIRGIIGQVGSAFPTITRRRTSGGAAERAEFTRAKERTGQLTQSALSALDEVLAGRGIEGPVAGEFAGSIIGKGQGNLSNVVLQQAIDALDRDERAVSEEFQGNIAQRGQQQNVIAQLLAILG